MLISLTLSTLLIGLSAALFSVTGGLMLSRLLSNWRLLPQSFRFSASFFAGSCVFLSLWRLLSWALDRADLSLYGALVGMVVGTVFGWREFVGFVKPLFSRSLSKEKLILLFILIVIPLVSITYWMQGDSLIRNWDNVGSVHAPRYANISIFIVEKNRIPIFGQDYEQSMLAAIPLFFKVNHPLWNLYVLLCLSLVMVTILFYSIARIFQYSRSQAIVRTLLVLGGNVALSFFLVQSFDNGFPLILSGKVDLIRSIGSYIVCLIWVFQLRNLSRYAVASAIVMGTVFSISWCLSGIQNIFLLVGTLLALFTWSLFRKKAQWVYLVSAGAFMIVAIAVSQKGGMLTRAEGRDSVSPPGVINFVKFPGRKEFLVNPTIPFSIFGRYWGDYSPHAIPFTLGTLKKFAAFSEWGNFIYTIEMNLWSSLKHLFFPLLGLILFGCGLVRRDSTFESRRASRRPELWNPLFCVAVLAFVIGIPFVALFEISWWRWGMTRFMIPGYTLGTLCLILYMDVWSSGDRVRRWAWRLMVAGLIFGPCLGIAVRVRDNLYSWSSYKHRVSVFVAPGTYID